MGRKLKLGWLFPYSGIFRSLKTDLKQGLQLGLEQQGITTPVEFYPEFIQTGSFKDTEDALKKLLLYEEVDLVMGVTSLKVALGLLPTLEARHTPAIIMNLGGDIPTRELSSDYLFYNSLHLWKSEWVIGKWAQQQYGGEPSINMSIYEGGYGLHESFKTGTSVSGAQTVKLNIVRNFSSTPDTGSLIEYIQTQSPNHAHALLSGKEGEQFLQLFNDHDLGSRVCLTVNPFMVEDGFTANISGRYDIFNASTWSLHLDRKENHSFRQAYSHSYDEQPNAFALLAYESGLALGSAMQELPDPSDRERLANALARVRPTGPRGDLLLSTRSLQTPWPVYIRKPAINSSTGQWENHLLESYTGVEWNDPSLATGASWMSGWQNPYLCV